MNETLNGLVLGAIPALVPKSAIASAWLAQTTTPTGGENFIQTIGTDLGTSLPNLLRAIFILVIGWLVALIASAIVKGILKQTSIDNRIARWVTGTQSSAESPPIEKWIASAVFWLIFIFTIVAFLQALQLTAVTEPLNNFLNQVIGYLPLLGGALILLGVAWLIATLVKLIVVRTLNAFRIDERLGQQLDDRPTRTVDPYTAEPYVGDPTDPRTTTPPPTTPPTTTAPPPSNNQFSLSETIGNALYWFIFLLFLPAILNALRLQGTLQPVQQLLNEILSILPNIFAAILIGAAGWLIAQVVRRIVTNFLAATGTDRIGARFGLGQTAGSNSLSWIVGTIVYILILIPTAIAALNALQIQAISQPAIAMLNQILNALPAIFTAAVILIIAYVIGHFLADLVTNILTGLGFNNIFYWLGLQSTPYTPTDARVPPAQPEGITPAAPPTTLPSKTPSEVVGIVVWVGIMLFAAVAAIQVLNIAALTALITGIVVISGRILAGLIVFAIGLYLANLAYSIITSSGGRQAQILGQTARIAIITLVSAMALQQIGVASDIVNLAFGLLLGSIAVAIAIAFGLGGREIAAEQIRGWLSSLRRDNPPY
ncbi:mechanosensitive ion channel [Oculatella sp. LEGE 06141]|uniref:mechanosensitive ion channel n=1 Tax=Oculatella sp. LEGE 06141 TaxID=1828648 RepID=UPI00187EBAD2|nr:mechanosensitive ion channel [Oculatella sp. LEGE 06141]MBE9181937.1 mechanosensitive ion channel [Oculatella sp. LEGE 06141]